MANKPTFKDVIDFLKAPPRNHSVAQILDMFDISLDRYKQLSAGLKKVTLTHCFFIELQTQGEFKAEQFLQEKDRKTFENARKVFSRRYKNG